MIPVYRLPENLQRLGEGGQRLRNTGEGQRQRPKFSIVTISLNAGSEIEPTITSALRWGGELVEYIVIDGGSTDETKEILKKYDDNIEYWVSEPDDGISDAFNKGIALCRGEVIGLINAGDWYEETTAELVVQRFAEDKDLGVLCGDLQFWDNGRRAFRCDAEPSLLYRDMTVTHPACFVRRDVYLNHGGFVHEYKIAMDYELLLRFFSRKVKFSRLHTILANMQHGGLAEIRWKQALQETHQVRQHYQPGSFYSSRLYLRYLIVRRQIRFMLQSLGMDGLIRWYRKHIAAVKKIDPGQ